MKNNDIGGMFGLGKENSLYSKYFIGKSFLNPVAIADNLSIYNVTFEPGCRNNYHIHHAKSGGGQILLCTAGTGFYKEERKPIIRLFPGDSVVIKAGVKHWHGATKDSYFSHLAIEVPGVDCYTEWLEPVSDSEYNALWKKR